MSLLTKLKNHFFGATNLDPNIMRYIESSYPSNHNYSIRGKRLIPSRKLAKRLKTFKKWYPQSCTSLLDLSCCKGYFVFDAILRANCERALGIDVCEQDLLVCQELKKYFQTEGSEFKAMYLHELADNINQFGGPFQTVLLINAYQYLFFGSDRDPHAYLSHDEIFNHIARITSERVIFNNRSELTDCQNRKQVEEAKITQDEYSSDAIFKAASQYFEVKKLGNYGGYPFWVMDKK